MESIIWDWNGTLLDDLDFCVETINILLEKRGLPLLNPKSYKEVFSFPVKDYYRAIGFDFSKEDFDIPAREFIDLYNLKVKNCHLNPSAVAVLSQFRQTGKRQFALSAMKQTMLELTLKQQNIYDFFEGIAGLNNHYAVSKIERGKQLISEFGIDTSRAWIIGDTIHDYEVAESLGIKCILIADGHQSASRLQTTGARILNNLEELISTDFFTISD